MRKTCEEIRPTFCATIASGVAFAFVIDGGTKLRSHGNVIGAFVTGEAPTALSDDLRQWTERYTTSGARNLLGPALFDMRWVDGFTLAGFINSPDDDGENLQVLTPWGIAPAPDGTWTSVAIFLNRAPSPMEWRVLVERVTEITQLRKLGPVSFRLVRQVVAVDTIAEPTA